MTLGEFIKKYREDNNNMSMQVLADKCGLSKGYISMFENNFIPNNTNKPITPSVETIKKLSKGMNVKFDYLLSLINDDVSWNEDEELYTNVGLDYIKVPLYSPICCGDGGFNDDNILDYIPVPSLKLSPRKEYFCQYAKGDSMKGAGIDNGDLLVFEKSSTIDNGLIGCFCVDENEAMCKKYTLVGGNIILMPMNSDYEPIAVDLLAFKCIGILKKVIKDF